MRLNCARALTDAPCASTISRYTLVYRMKYNSEDDYRLLFSRRGSTFHPMVQAQESVRRDPGRVRVRSRCLRSVYHAARRGIGKVPCSLRSLDATFRAVMLGFAIAHLSEGQFTLLRHGVNAAAGPCLRMLDNLTSHDQFRLPGLNLCVVSFTAGN